MRVLHVGQGLGVLLDSTNGLSDRPRAWRSPSRPLRRSPWRSQVTGGRVILTIWSGVLEGAGGQEVSAAGPHWACRDAAFAALGSFRVPGGALAGAHTAQQPASPRAGSGAARRRAKWRLLFAPTQTARPIQPASSSSSTVAPAAQTVFSTAPCLC